MEEPKPVQSVEQAKKEEEPAKITSEKKPAEPIQVTYFRDPKRVEAGKLSAISRAAKKKKAAANTTRTTTRRKPFVRLQTSSLFWNSKYFSCCDVFANNE